MMDPMPKPKIKPPEQDDSLKKTYDVLGDIVDRIGYIVAVALGAAIGYGIAVGGLVP